MKKNSFQRLAEEASLEMRFESSVERRSTTSLEQRALMLLRALYGREDFGDEKVRAARNIILEEMAAELMRGTKRDDTSTGLPPDKTFPGRGEAVQYSKRVYLSTRSVDFSAKAQAPDPDFSPDAFEPLASRASPRAERVKAQEIEEAALSAIQEALHVPQPMARRPRAASKKGRSWDPIAIFVVVLMGLGAIGLWTVAQWGVQLFSSYYYR